MWGEEALEVALVGVSGEEEVAAGAALMEGGA